MTSQHLEQIETEILKAMPEPVLVVDKEGLCVLWLNPAAQSLFRLSLKSAFGRPLAGIAHGMHFLSKQLADMPEMPEMPEMQEILGSKLYLKTQNEQEQVFQYIIFFAQDKIVIKLSPLYSDKIHIDNELVAVNMLGRMLAHELKNPLAGIDGAAQLLNQALTDPSDKELTSLIRSEVKRIARLADEMERFNEMPSQDFCHFNVHKVLRKALLIVKAKQRNGLEFIESYDPSLPEVYGIADKISQLVINLLSNSLTAIESSGIGDQIELVTRYRNGVWGRNKNGEKYKLPIEIRVVDNGPGIDKNISDRLFQPFVTTKANGHGLGLALVAKIVNEHGGLIEFTSRQGQTVFSILLPNTNPIQLNPGQLNPGQLNPGQIKGNISP